MSRVFLALFLLAFGSPRTVPAQAPAVGRLHWRAAEPFSSVASLDTLRDGRLVVVDSREGTLSLVDKRTGAVSRLGRTGSGPNEYRRPFAVTRMTGDTLFVYDVDTRRFLRISPSGALAGSIPFPSLMPNRGYAPPGGSDSLGNLYWESVIIDRMPDGSFQRNQKYVVIRWRPGSDPVEVAALDDHAKAQHGQRFHPYPVRDAWAVSPDGRLAVVRGSDYRVEWLHHGAVVRAGPSVGDVPQSLGAAEREHFRRQRAMQPAGRAAVQGQPGRDKPTPAQRRATEQAYPDELFPRTLPPFGGEHPVWLLPGGDVWVVRTVSVRDPAVRIDVFDSAGRRRNTITLPAGRRLVGLTGDRVYLVQTDADGLEWLESYGR